MAKPKGETRIETFDTMAKIEYIKANGEYYYQIEKGLQDPSKLEGCFRPISTIKKRMYGRYQIDYYDDMLWPINGYRSDDNQSPNSRIILYPSGIEEIKYKVNHPRHEY